MMNNYGYYSLMVPYLNWLRKMNYMDEQEYIELKDLLEQFKQAAIEEGTFYPPSRNRLPDKKENPTQR